MRTEPPARNHEYFTHSARECFFALQEWAQDSRLYSEAIFRLKTTLSASREPFSVTKDAWPLGQEDKYRFPQRVTEQRLERLRDKNWRSQFIQLEGIWEIYLEMLYVELSQSLPEALEELCRQSPPDFLVRSVLAPSKESLEDLRTRTAEWLASNLTRKSWSEQWSELQRLKIGLSEKHKKEPWWLKLDIYFEMRNCFVHRSGRPSDLLRAKDPDIVKQLDEKGNIRLGPRQLQFFWIQFLNVVTAIDKSLSGRLRACLDSRCSERARGQIDGHQS